MIVGISGVSESGKDTVAGMLARALRGQPGLLGRSRPVANIAFADPLKRVVRDVYDFSVDQLWGPTARRNEPDTRYPRPSHDWQLDPKTGETKCACCGLRSDLPDGHPELGPCYLTPRYAIIRLGTEWGRCCYLDTWANVTVRDAKVLLNDSRAFYTPDRGVQRNGGSISGTSFVTVSDVRFRNEFDALKRAGAFLVRVIRPNLGDKHYSSHQSEAEQLEIPSEEFDHVIINDKGLTDLSAKVYGFASDLLDLLHERGQL